MISHTPRIWLFVTLSAVILWHMLPNQAFGSDVVDIYRRDAHTVIVLNLRTHDLIFRILDPNGEEVYRSRLTHHSLLKLDSSSFKQKYTYQFAIPSLLTSNLKERSEQVSVEIAKSKRELSEWILSFDERQSLLKRERDAQFTKDLANALVFAGEVSTYADGSLQVGNNPARLVGDNGRAYNCIPLEMLEQQDMLQHFKRRDLVPNMGCRWMTAGALPLWMGLGAFHRFLAAETNYDNAEEKATKDEEMVPKRLRWKISDLEGQIRSIADRLVAAEKFIAQYGTDWNNFDPYPIRGRRAGITPIIAGDLGLTLFDQSWSDEWQNSVGFTPMAVRADTSIAITPEFRLGPMVEVYEPRDVAWARLYLNVGYGNASQRLNSAISPELLVNGDVTDLSDKPIALRYRQPHVGLELRMWRNDHMSLDVGGGLTGPGQLSIWSGVFREVTLFPRIEYQRASTWRGWLESPTWYGQGTVRIGGSMLGLHQTDDIWGINMELFAQVYAEQFPDWQDTEEFPLLSSDSGESISLPSGTRVDFTVGIGFSY